LLRKIKELPLQRVGGFHDFPQNPARGEAPDMNIADLGDGHSLQRLGQTPERQIITPDSETGKLGESKARQAQGEQGRSDCGRYAEELSAADPV
jgi:hypothetical protein